MLAKFDFSERAVLLLQGATDVELRAAIDTYLSWRPHVQAWLSWSERGTFIPQVVASIPSKTRKLKSTWIWAT